MCVEQASTTQISALFLQHAKTAVRALSVHCTPNCTKKGSCDHNLCKNGMFPFGSFALHVHEMDYAVHMDIGNDKHTIKKVQHSLWCQVHKCTSVESCRVAAFSHNREMLYQFSCYLNSCHRVRIYGWSELIGGARAAGCYGVVSWQ